MNYGMQIPRRILLAGVTAIALIPLTLAAEDNSAQAKARQALEQKMKVTEAPPAVKEQPAAASAAKKQAPPPAAKSAKPANPTAAKTPPPASAAPAAASPSPMSGPEFQPIPAQTEEEAAAVAKAQEALRKKMATMNEQPVAAAPAAAARVC